MKNERILVATLSCDGHRGTSFVTTWQQLTVARTTPTQAATMTTFSVPNMLIRGPMNKATQSWARYALVPRKETAFPFVSLSSVHGLLSRIPDSCTTQGRQGAKCYMKQRWYTQIQHIKCGLLPSLLRKRRPSEYSTSPYQRGGWTCMVDLCQLNDWGHH